MYPATQVHCPELAFQLAVCQCSSSRAPDATTNISYQGFSHRRFNRTWSARSITSVLSTLPQASKYGNDVDTPLLRAWQGTQ